MCYQDDWAQHEDSVPRVSGYVDKAPDSQGQTRVQISTGAYFITVHEYNASNNLNLKLIKISYLLFMIE